MRIFILVCVIVSGPTFADDGRLLAQSWCSSCHQFPAPELLSKDTWINNVLPEMGAILGFSEFRGRKYIADGSAPHAEYAAEPLLGVNEWEQIITYYEQNAPIKLITPSAQKARSIDQFEIELPEKIGFDIPVTTAAFIDDTTQLLLIGEGAKGTLTIYSKELSAIDEVFFDGPISRISRLNDKAYLVTSMGAIDREVEPIGSVSIVRPDPNNPRKFYRVPLFKNLLRPVDALALDINNDNLEDYVVADYGRYSGKLSLFIAEQDATFREVILLNEDGAISVEFDGEDIIALVAQENERIVRFRNLAADRQPVEEILVSFPPSQGSSNLSVLDFNGDGINDLLYSAGDNADISRIFKPYHGVYLYLGQADGSVKLEMFRHLDGAYGAVARDFDHDGDLDIAAIGYFANFEVDTQTTGFMYLENTGAGFEAKKLNGIGNFGRWAVINASDIDGDGDEDIVLGNLAYGALGAANVANEHRDKWLNGPNFVLLRNSQIKPAVR